MDVYIRQVTLSDAVLLSALSRQTFSDTFAADNKADDMEQYMTEAFSVEQLEKEIRHPNTAFYLAYCEQEVAGYLKLNEHDAQTEWQLAESMEIERIYVLYQFQHKGIGRLLMDKAFAIARENAREFIWLGVWEKNHKALQFYKRLGFTAFGEHLFVLGTDAQTDVLMKCML